jgi:hypothetical protein
MRDELAGLLCAFHKVNCAFYRVIHSGHCLTIQAKLVGAGKLSVACWFEWMNLGRWCDALKRFITVDWASLRLLLWSTNGHFHFFYSGSSTSGLATCRFRKEKLCTCIIRIKGNFTLRGWHYKTVFVIHVTPVLCFMLLFWNARWKVQTLSTWGAIAGGWATLSIVRT